MGSMERTGLLSSGSPGLLTSPLILADRHLLRGSHYDGRSFYSGSWLYVLRTCTDDRGQLGFKLGAPGLVAAVGQTGPVLPVATLRYDRLTSAAVGLRSIYNGLVTEFQAAMPILKRLPEELAAAVLSQGDYTALPEGLPLELALDDSFPETAVDLGALLARPPATLARKTARFETSSLTLTKQTGGVPEDVAHRALRRLAWGRPQLIRAYRWMVYEALLHRSPRYSVWFFWNADEPTEPHGLYLADRLAPDCAGLYCGLSSRAAPGITEWMDMEVCRDLHDAGVTKLLIGGSETPGVESYTRKLNPVPAGDPGHTLVRYDVLERTLSTHGSAPAPVALPQPVAALA